MTITTEYHAVTCGKLDSEYSPFPKDDSMGKIFRNETSVEDDVVTTHGTVNGSSFQISNCLEEMEEIMTPGD
ncbi:hypothetical protein BLA29_015303, partial [Euroglyphus maynei]